MTELEKYRRRLTCLRLERAAVGVDVLPDIILLGQVEQLADLGGPLGSAHPGLLRVSQPGEVVLT